MDLSIKEVARILNVSETTVRNHIASGKLPARRKGRQVRVSRSDLSIFASSPSCKSITPEENADDPVGTQSLRSEDLQAVVDRISGLEEQMRRFHELLTENRLLSKQLKDLEQEIARKDLEIEKLRRDLVYQSRIQKKELEDHQKIIQEKWSVMEKEAAERIAREREHFESRLVQEQGLWSERLALEQSQWAERLAQERENHARKLHEATRQEGFWSRLLKMMTWS